MDNSYPYIASLTREPFLFYEMRTTAKLMCNGLSDDEIVKQIVQQNLFRYPTEKFISRIARACIKRLHGLKDEMLVSGIASQPTDVAKQICLYAMMRQSRLYSYGKPPKELPLTKPYEFQDIKNCGNH